MNSPLHPFLLLIANVGLMVSTGVAAVCLGQPAVAQRIRSDCPTLEKAILPAPQDTKVRSVINQKFGAKGEDGAYNLVVIGRYGMAGWYSKAAGTITPMAVLIDGDRVQSYLLNPYSVERLVKLGYPQPTAQCLDQLFNEAGI